MLPKFRHKVKIKHIQKQKNKKTKNFHEKSQKISEKSRGKFLHFFMLIILTH